LPKNLSLKFQVSQQRLLGIIELCISLKFWLAKVEVAVSYISKVVFEGLRLQPRAIFSV